ncbi:hypothetical protein [Azospirillum canadense]|uniref:hypothetical protein n=1 Tax=Azospirillum canadense TaxID=403962 RepID=UPI002226708C|nr:hypothetical protein [Azospirillum canadense]MCW2240760.1 hypothetical protein [Azospirillum canadense]
MEHHVLMGELLSVRDELGCRNSAVAAAMGMTDSSFSRVLKKSEVGLTEAYRFLTACGFPHPDRFLNFQNSRWEKLGLDRVSWRHPDRDYLYDLVRAVERLDLFTSSTKCDVILIPRVKRLREQMVGVAKFLANREHTIAFMGEAGRGKTTVICSLIGLMLDDRTGLPTSAGLTTLCEMAFCSGVEPAVDIVPCPDEDVATWVRQWLDSKCSLNETPVTAEIAKALLNMSDLADREKRARLKTSGGSPAPSPLEALCQSFADPDERFQEVMRRVNLPGRKTVRMVCPDGADPTEWICSTVTRINNGSHPDVTIPLKITITLPRELAPDLPFQISIVDTKGIDGTTKRQDLFTLVEDARTLSVLCSAFTSVDTAVLDVIREDEERGTKAARDQRLCVLLLAKWDEALQVLGDDQLPVEDAEEGYEVKRVQIQRSLTSGKVSDVPISLFNARKDKPATLWAELLTFIETLREPKRRAATAYVSLVDRLEQDTDLVRVEEGNRVIAQHLTELVKRVRSLPAITRDPRAGFLKGFRRAHASSLAASMRRQGLYAGFSVPLLIATECRTIANDASGPAIKSIEEAIRQMNGLFGDFAPVHVSLEAMGSDFDDAQTMFLFFVEDHARRLFENFFTGEKGTEWWKRIQDEYGRGTGYKGRVQTRFDDWLEHCPHFTEMVEQVRANIHTQWQSTVVECLEKAIKDAQPNGQDPDAS